MKQFVLFLAMEVGRARDQRGKPTALLGFYINAEGWSRVWAKTGNALRPCTHESWQRLIHNFGCAARANTPWVSPIAANSGVLSQEGGTKRSTLHNLSIQSWSKMKKAWKLSPFKSIEPSKNQHTTSYHMLVMIFSVAVPQNISKSHGITHPSQWVCEGNRATITTQWDASWPFFGCFKQGCQFWSRMARGMPQGWAAIWSVSR